MVNGYTWPPDGRWHARRFSSSSAPFFATLHPRPAPFTPAHQQHSLCRYTRRRQEGRKRTGLLLRPQRWRPWWSTRPKKGTQISGKRAQDGRKDAGQRRPAVATRRPIRYHRKRCLPVLFLSSILYLFLTRHSVNDTRRNCTSRRVFDRVVGPPFSWMPHDHLSWRLMAFS